MPRRIPHAENPRPNVKRLSKRLRGYDARWRKISKIKLARNPLCEFMRDGAVCNVPAVEVDHIDNDRANIAWSNLRSGCKSCHSRKTVREDGGFGRAPEKP